ncbi:YhgE/Pip domain-containing protein [Neobacillus sp. CF12]|uniref:YhgE/Pip domain-containing protein n=1 Tax=Neobacillus sp. CF12 TaxID=3055864 RepID=UPI0025A10376|nr:YhgE/Pip domain-containing protein [Neobacillus sp. CF12]MDM5326168.1 YhgE/Pip domain-containing protein [Neobacillus sp. CF12]
MRKIWSIYTTDWKNIFSVPTVALLVVGLMLLPSTYAWFNIKSMWDPYGNTSGIIVAVANEDEGAVVRLTKQKINVGEDTIKNLKKNKKLGWVFVDQKEAIRGVKHGDYYAYLIIPKEFSKKITSILEENPEKPQIIFGVNEKINAVAPKIAATGATGVTTQISEAFIKTVGDAIFSAFYNAGVELEKELPSIFSVENQIFELEKALPQIEEMGRKAIELEGKLPEIHEKGQQIVALEQRIPELDQVGANILKVEESLPLVMDAGEQVLAMQERLNELSRTTAIINDVVTHITEIETQIKQAMDSVNEVNQSGTTTNPEQLTALYNELMNIHDIIQNTRTDLQQKVDQVTSGINTAADFVKDVLPTVEQKIHKAADFVRNDLPKVESNIREAADLIRTKLPAAEQTIHKAADFARNDLPGFEEKVRNAADRLRQFKRSVNIYDLIEYLKHDPNKESSFLAKPILLNTERIFPIPNYGSAMTPFYTMLALWVGGTLLVSSLRVDVENAESQYKHYQIYFGRLLTFLTIGILQAVIVSIGDIYLIHAYIADKLWFVLFCIFISIVFTIIIYTLCSVFGNIGKGLSIILLVLQISSSGATFPVSLTPSFFQTLHPFVPFTYAVSLLRETVGGLIKSIVIRDTLYLLIFVGISFLLALALKRTLGAWIHRTAERAKSTKIVP